MFYVNEIVPVDLVHPVTLEEDTTFMHIVDAVNIRYWLICTAVEAPPARPHLYVPIPPTYAHGQIAYRYLYFIEENLYSRIPFTYREYETARWIAAELARMGHPEENIYLQEFPIGDNIIGAVVEMLNLNCEPVDEIPDGLRHFLAAQNIYTMDDILQHTFRRYSQNVILTVPGASARRIIVGAHYDSPNSPGISDNAGGIVMLLESAYRILNLDHYYTITYIFFGAEEVGLVGAFYYVNSLSQEEIENIVLMINIDVIFDGFQHTFGAGYHANGTENHNHVTEAIINIAAELNYEFSLGLSHQRYGIYMPSDQLAFAPLGVQILTMYNVRNISGMFSPAMVYMLAPQDHDPILTPERLQLVLAMLDETDCEETLAAIEADRFFLDMILTEIAMVDTAFIQEIIAELDDNHEIAMLEIVIEIMNHPAHVHTGMPEVEVRPIAEPVQAAVSVHYYSIFVSVYEYHTVKMVSMGDDIYFAHENYTQMSESFGYWEYLGDGLFLRTVPLTHHWMVISYEENEDGSITKLIYWNGQYQYITVTHIQTVYAEAVASDDWRMGLVLHTPNDNLTYLNENFPGLAQAALKAYSLFLERVLTLP